MKMTRKAGWLARAASLSLIALTVAGCASVGTRSAPRPDLVAHYDFEHPMPGDPTREQDRGLSGTPLVLINGGSAMRVEDGAHPRSRYSIQTRQVNPAVDGNDDWKAGNYSETGVGTLRAFSQARGITVMGWAKRTGAPGRNSNTPAPDDVFNAVGLFGVLTGTSSGHDVRALLEVIGRDNG